MIRITFYIHRNRGSVQRTFHTVSTRWTHCCAVFSNEFSLSPLSFYDRIKSNARPRSNLNQYSPWSRPVRKCSLERDYSNDPDLLAVAETRRIWHSPRSIDPKTLIYNVVRPRSFPPREMFSPTQVNWINRSDSSPLLDEWTNDRAQPDRIYFLFSDDPIEFAFPSLNKEVVRIRVALLSQILNSISIEWRLRYWFNLKLAGNG